MPVQLPSEIVVQRFLPTARAMLAAELDARGFTQQAIADRLGVTQAAVSKYLNENVPTEDRFREDHRMQTTVERIAAGFADGSMDDYEALGELLALVREFEDRGPICEIHEEEMPALEGLGCDLCIRGLDADVSEERAALASVRRAARRIADTPAVVDHIPNVGMNIGMALADASDELDVAAVPGRIHSLRGRVNVPSNPEFGASEHVATTILTAMNVDTSIRGALNLATSEAVIDAARERGFDPVEFEAGYDGRADRLEARFRDAGRVPTVIYHEGAMGIEPITYVLAETAEDAAAHCCDLVAAANDTGE
jgi:predicted fused transcriptional regulator/phosphomethylpyrimidine kinase/predicted transcriptional regulator